MWSKVSLQHRLNILFGALLLLWLLIDVGRILMDSGPRAAAESESVTRLTGEFVTTALAHVQDAAEPERALSALVASLQNLRHVRVGWVADGDASGVSAFVAAADERTPGWFHALARTPISVSAIPVL